MDYSLRVEQDRDNTITAREDMVLDIVDCFQVIKSEDGYKTDPITNEVWRVEELNIHDLPANLVFDMESEVIDKGSNWRHKLNITLEHVTAEGIKTSNILNRGVQDMLKAFGLIHSRFVKKYNCPLPVKLLSTLKGVESEERTKGVMDAVIQVEYITKVWEF